LAGIAIREIDGGVVFGVKVVPEASRTEISGIMGDKLKIKVSAPAEKGKANRCLVEFLAKIIGVKKSDVSIISGQTSRSKQIQVLGISDESLRDRFKVNE
jgi:uncharacterized protein (TIGR00251 family)